MEYVSKNDYFVGVIMVLDFRKTNLVALLRNLSLVELQQVLTMIMVNMIVFKLMLFK